jgi:hypothetical protein
VIGHASCKPFVLISTLYFEDGYDIYVVIFLKEGQQRRRRAGIPTNLIMSN